MNMVLIIIKCVKLILINEEEYTVIKNKIK